MRRRILLTYADIHHDDVQDPGGQCQRCAVKVQSGYPLDGRCQSGKGYSGESRRADCGCLQDTDNDPDTSWYIRDGRVSDVKDQEEEPIGKTVASDESYRIVSRVKRRT